MCRFEKQVKLIEIFIQTITTSSGQIVNQNSPDMPHS